MGFSPSYSKLFREEFNYFFFEIFKVFDYNCPDNIFRNRIISMAYSVSCVDNFSGVCYLDIGLNFQYSIHSFTDYFNVSFNCFPSF